MSKNAIEFEEEEYSSNTPHIKHFYIVLLKFCVHKKHSPNWSG